MTLLGSTTNCCASETSDSINRNRRRLQNKTFFDKIAGTARHDEIKNRKCDKRAELFGTPEHDKIKC